MKIEKYKYTMNLIRCFLKDNDIDYGSYSIKDYCTDATVGYLDYSVTKCKVTVIPSLAKYGQSENELIVSIISDNCYLESKPKYFYTIGSDLKTLLADESHYTDAEIDAKISDDSDEDSNIVAASASINAGSNIVKSTNTDDKLSRKLSRFNNDSIIESRKKMKKVQAVSASSGKKA